MLLTYTIVESGFGKLLVAATDKGVCRVMLGDTEEELTGALLHEFSKAEIKRDDKPLRSHVATLMECLAGGAPRTELPLDVRGTPFQTRVWEELRRIPRGRTVTYGELAAKIGRPTAVRAVARACAANPVAVFTPCHRVIRADGKPGGYRWGIERKRELLDKEKTRSGE